MKNSVFTKYFYICITTILFGSILVGLVLLLRANALYREDSYEEVNAIARMLIADSTDAYSETGNLDSQSIQDDFTYYSITYSLSCYLFDEKGVCQIRSDLHAGEDILLSPSLMNSVGKKPVFEIDTFNGLTTGLSACYVERFTLYNTETAHPYYIVLTYPAERLTYFTTDLFILFFLCILALMLLSSVVFYFNTKHLLKPIAEITDAAEQYAKGDFSPKLPTTGKGELSYLAMTMNRMSDFIDSNEKNRKTFVSNVSHELRTPMTTISGFVDGILDGTIPPEEQTQYLRSVSGEIKRLSRLVNSMLNISKFEEGEMELNYQSIDLTELLISTLFLFEQKIEAKHLEIAGLDTCQKVILPVDKDLMQQVFYNLLENAIKFVDDGGTLSFFAEIDKPEKQVCFHLRNTGEGLTEEEISRVFDRFYKTDASRGKDATGVGLGLSIVSRIIRLHNGKIMVKSIKDEYTEFVICLPLTQKSK